MKVIFLDFDGVLNNTGYRNSAKDYYEDFIDESRIPLLKYIVDSTGAVIVLTTTWRHYWSEDETDTSLATSKINAIFNKYGLKIHSKTGSFHEQRDYEIRMFLCCNDVDNYVIVDDVDFGWSEINRGKFVKTDDSKLGLDECSAAEAIRILNQ